MMRMSGLDASFLYWETPAQLMQVCSLLILDPTTIPGGSAGSSGYSFASFKRHIDNNTQHLRVFRERIKRVPLDLDHPVWVSDEHYDIDRHVHRVHLPGDGTRSDLAAFCAHLASQPISRERALWDMHVIEGLDDGKLAVFLKIHHSAVDGVSGASVFSALCSLEPDAPALGSDDKLIRSTPTDGELFAKALLSRSLSGWRGLVGLQSGLTSLKTVLSIGKSGREEPQITPGTSFNGTITGHRSLGFGDFSLKEAKRIKDSFPAIRMNDVVMSLTGGAVRRYLDDRGELPAESLVAAVPIVVATPSQRTQGADQVAAVYADLGTNIADPVQRLHHFSDFSAEVAEQSQAVPAQALRDWAEFAAPSTFSLAGRVLARVRETDSEPVLHNLVASNVPGPPQPLYFQGAKVLGMYPFGPISHGAGLNITVLSSAQSLHLGIIACTEMVPHPEDLVAAFAAEFKALKAAARKKRRRGSDR